MPQPRPHLVLIGGFLGAGKTTALVALAEWLANQGIRAGFVTNDQGKDLVDTRLLRFCGAATEEIAGGCFCCRFNDLVDATQRLRAVLRPDLFVAEAVGSCTDLVATVAYPMRRLLGDRCTIAPLSVLVDPVRARRALGLDTGEQFSGDVQYIYRKQLEEADVVVITKSDLLTAAALDELRDALHRDFPLARVFVVSTRNGNGIEKWFHHLLFHEQQQRSTMALDYDRYADGEARLGWLNASAQATTTTPGDGNALLVELATALRGNLRERNAAVAHLKMTLQSGEQIAAINLVRDDMLPEAGLRCTAPILAATLTVNLRAESAPELLEELVREALTGVTGWEFNVVHLEAFRPGRPEPTHRDTVTPSSN
jgi:G3E family GTPase